MASALGATLAPALASVEFASKIVADADGTEALGADVEALKATLEAYDAASLETYYGADLLGRLVAWLKTLAALWDVVKAQVQAAADAAAAEAEGA